MASPLKLSLVIEAIDRATAPVKRIAGAVQHAGKVAAEIGRKTGEALERVNGGFEQIATLVGGGIEVRDLVKDDNAFQRLGIIAGATQETIEKLRASVLETARATGAPVSELNAALMADRDAGGSIKLYEQNIGNLAAMIELLNGHGADLGNMLANLDQRFNIKGPKQFAEVLATLRQQTIDIPQGFQGLALALPDLASSYAQLGHTGAQAARELGAVYAVIAKSAGSPSEARSETQNLLDQLQDTGFVDRLRTAGVETMEQPGNMYDTRRLPLPQILNNLMKQINQDPRYMERILGPQILRDLKIPLGEMAATGHSATLDSKLNTGATPAGMFKDAARMGNLLDGSLAKLHAALQQIGEDILSSPIRQGADILAKWNKPVAYLLSGLGAVSAAAMAVRWGRFVWDNGFGFVWRKLESASPRVIKWIGRIGSKALEILPKVGGLFGRMVGWIGRMGAAALDLIPEMGALFAALIDGLVAVGTAIMATPVGWIAAGIAAVAAGAFLVWRNWSTIKSALVGEWTAIKAAFHHSWVDGIARVLMDFMPWTWVARGINGLVKHLTGVDLGAAGTAMITTLTSAITRVWDATIGKIRADVRGLGDWVANLGHGIGSSIGDAGRAIGSLLPWNHGADRPSAMRRSAVGAGGGADHKVTVEFKNAPAGTRVGANADRNSPLGLDLSVGYAMMGP